MTEDVINSTAVDEDATPGTSVAVVDTSTMHAGIIRADSPDEILTKATQIANALKGLIDGQNLAVSVGGKKKHVEVGAWQACGTMLGALGGQALHAETVWTRPVLGDDGVTPRRTRYTAEVKHFKWVNQKREHVSTTTYDVDGFDWEACVEVRTADGVVHGRAEAMVSRAEETWNSRDDFALRSMAETRAESRAYRRAIGWIVHLAGYSPTPAEEMGHTPGAEPAGTGPAFGEAASPDQAGQMRRAVAYLLEVGEESPRVKAVLGAIEHKADGYMPAIAARAVGVVAGAVKTSRPADQQTTAGEPPAQDPARDELAAAEPTEPQAGTFATEAAIAALIKADARLQTLRATADAGMRALHTTPGQRLRELQKRGDELALEQLIESIASRMPIPANAGDPA